MKSYSYTINGVKYHVEILEIEGDIAHLEVNGTRYEVELEKPGKVKPLARKAPKVEPTATVAAPAPAPTAAPSSTPRPAASTGGGKEIHSPLPGVIFKVEVQVGDTVKKGQRIMILEAMKMENDIKAPADGKVLSLAVSQGDSIQEGALLATIG
ncbi:MAG: biotin/lipoyl-containing protein [Porphyromonas sp.]|nr:biotin/lipoyl-containing protein [Porphyromonas sp.]